MTILSATYLKSGAADGFMPESGSRRFVSTYLARDQV
jgi:hypothetical protein